MLGFGVDKLCEQLCQSVINSQVSSEKELKYLLPIKHIISNYGQ